VNRRSFLIGGVAIAALAKPAVLRAAQFAPPQSANWRSDCIFGDPADGTGLMTFNGSHFARQPQQGNGFKMPARALIVSVSIAHNIMNGGCGNETAFIGHWSNGKPTVDMISEEIVGSTSRTVHYGADERPVWSEGDFFDCHVMANLADHWHYVDFNVCCIPLDAQS
jgi:hypothetical protein